MCCSTHSIIYKIGADHFIFQAIVASRSLFVTFDFFVVASHTGKHFSLSFVLYLVNRPVFQHQSGFIFYRYQLGHFCEVIRFECSSTTVISSVFIVLMFVCLFVYFFCVWVFLVMVFVWVLLIKCNKSINVFAALVIYFWQSSRSVFEQHKISFAPESFTAEGRSDEKDKSTLRILNQNNKTRKDKNYIKKDKKKNAQWKRKKKNSRIGKTRR